MSWRITFYSADVEQQILRLPAGTVARFLRYAETMEMHGPDLGMPHTRAMRRMPSMSSTLKRFRARALARPEVKREYQRIGGEFELLGELLRARTAAGLTQADVAARIGTTQSAVARLESADSRHSPSIATLQRYASALGCRLQVRLVRDQLERPRDRRNGR